MLAGKMFQIYDLVLIASYQNSMMRKYEDDGEMAEKCEHVIRMFDSSFWEVFSKDDQFLARLHGKFGQVFWTTAE